ncbi:MAG: M23 family metallopeptidase [Tannerella sp.]|jgi:lipoprotein NlpD|nr:M23 family metallopeptidase [Tannerella sp.]
MKRKHANKSFWKRIRFKYKLLFFNESTLEEVWSFRLSQLSVFIYTCIFAFVLITLTSTIIILTPIRNYLPGYLDVEVRKEILENALRADSLEEKIAIQSNYIRNISDILSGNISVDSIQSGDTLSFITSDYDIPRSDRESAFLNKFEEEEKYNLTALNPSPVQTEIFFYRPLNGIISSAFSEEKQHFGIDLTAAPKENVIATLDGTVVYAGFDPKYGNVISLQHKNDFISIYKHNDILLKEVGDRVAAGEAIAIAGNTGELSTGPHLHFELWQKGAPVNPEEYIAF